MRPYQHYGMAEGVANFSQLPDRNIVIDEDYSVVEFIPFANTNRIIGSSLTNYAMPLLRWDMKDTAEYEYQKDLGRVIKSIDGRVEDYITLPDGTKIGKLDHLFKDTVHIKEAQIRQKKDYSVVISYVTNNDEDAQEDLKQVDKLFRESCSSKIDVSYQKVTELEKTKSGKLRFVVSEVGGVCSNRLISDCWCICKTICAENSAIVQGEAA